MLKRLPGERPQTQQSLDGGDAPSADDNPEALHAPRAYPVREITDERGRDLPMPNRRRGPTL